MTDTTASTSGAWGVGLATSTPDGRILDTWFPGPALADPDALAAASRRLGGSAPGTVRLDPAAASAELGVDVAGACGPDPRRGVERVPVATFVARLDDPPVDAPDAYLRLHLLSHRLVAPHGANLDGIFGLLSNVVWTSAGPCPVDGFERTRLAL